MSRQTHTEEEQGPEWKLFLTAVTEVATDSSTAESNGAARDQRGILGEKGKKSNKKVFPLPYFEFVLALTNQLCRYVIHKTVTKLNT